MHDAEIHGEKVVLVPLRGDDAEDLSGLLEDPVIRGFLGVADLANLRRRFGAWESRRAPHGGERWLNWVVRAREDRRALGWLQATVEGAAATVAWALLPAARGRGAASDGVRAMTAWLRTTRAVDEVIATIAPWNAASERVARAGGFMRTDRIAHGERVWIRPRLGRGINIGGALDGGAGDWLEDEHFAAIRRAGFHTVRLPVRWPTGGPVDERFFARVDRAVDAALARDLDVVLTVHHFDLSTAARLPALWTQIAQRYAGAGRRLCFELLNEPHDPMTPEDWNRLLPAALAAVRAVSPDRDAIAGPARWNIVAALHDLRLPEDDHLVVTVHYYSPFRFTHQGAGWVEGTAAWRGTRWGTAPERARVRADLEAAAAWARDRGRPLFLGEFGAIEHAATADRAAWTELVRSEAERLGISWAYWDFATDFGVYDRERESWRAPLERALLAARA